MILVDTSVLIDFFKGNKNNASLQLENIIRQRIPFGLTPVVYQEILQSAKNKKEFDFLDEYLRCQHFYLPSDPLLTYNNAARIYFTCRKRGVTIRSTVDCLIAQIAIEHDLMLLQNDKDFVKMAPIINLKLYQLT